MASQGRYHHVEGCGWMRIEPNCWLRFAEECPEGRQSRVSESCLALRRELKELESNDVDGRIDGIDGLMDG